jgi:hypothetical protein
VTFSPSDATLLALIAENPGLRNDPALFKTLVDDLENSKAKKVAKALIGQSQAKQTRSLASAVKTFRTWAAVNSERRGRVSARRAGSTKKSSKKR